MNMSLGKANPWCRASIPLASRRGYRQQPRSSTVTGTTEGLEDHLEARDNYKIPSILQIVRAARPEWLTVSSL